MYYILNQPDESTFFFIFCNFLLLALERDSPCAGNNCILQHGHGAPCWFEWIISIINTSVACQDFFHEAIIARCKSTVFPSKKASAKVLNMNIMSRREDPILAVMQVWNWPLRASRIEYVCKLLCHRFVFTRASAGNNMSLLQAHTHAAQPHVYWHSCVCIANRQWLQFPTMRELFVCWGIKWKCRFSFYYSK